MRRARLSALLYLFVHFAFPSGALALSAGDFLVLDGSRQAIFQIDSATGARNVISGCPILVCPAGSEMGGGAPMLAPTGLARAASLDTDLPFYVTDSFSDSVLRIDPNTGFRTVVSSALVGTGTGFISPASVTVQSNGDLLVVDEGLDALVRVDANTGNRTILSSSTVGLGVNFSRPHDLFIHPDGDVFVLDTLLDAVFRVDVSSGDRTMLSLAPALGPLFVDPRNIARDAAGNILVSDATFSPTLPGAVYRIDPITGQRTLVSANGVGTGRQLETPNGMTLDSQGNIVLVDLFAGVLLAIDPATGDRTVLNSSVSGSGLSLEGPSVVVSISVLAPIPEPGTALLLGLGFALLARYDPSRRRKR